MRQSARDISVTEAPNRKTGTDKNAAKFRKLIKKVTYFGIAIHRAHRTNTSKKHLLCKIPEIQNSGVEILCKLYTAHDTIKSAFRAEDLVDLKNVLFPLLNKKNVQRMDEISLIIASRADTRWVAISLGLCSC